MFETDIFNFAAVILIQLTIFIIHGVFANDKKPVFIYLWKGMLIALPFGLAFDLIVGKQFGMFTYELGFQPWFLLLNAIFSYGFWIANVFLLHDHSIKHMVAWSILIGIVYEVSNYVFPVWEWTFSTQLIEYVAIVFLAYPIFAWFVMLMLRITYKARFRLIPF